MHSLQEGDHAPYPNGQIIFGLLVIFGVSIILKIASLKIASLKAGSCRLRCHWSQYRPKQMPLQDLPASEALGQTVGAGLQVVLLRLVDEAVRLVEPVPGRRRCCQC